MGSLVIKVQYGDMLRRFSSCKGENDKPEYDISRLREKISSLYNFPLDADFTMKYVDEDGDVVTLVDDEDLDEVIIQNLKFLKIDVCLKNEKLEKLNTSSGSSASLRLPRAQNPIWNTYLDPMPVLYSIPRSIVELMSDQQYELVMQVARVSVVLAEIGDRFLNMCQSSINSISQSKPRAHNPIRNTDLEIIEVHNFIPKPILETISEQQYEMVKEVARSSAVLAELGDCFLNMCQSSMNSTSQSKPSTQEGACGITSASFSDSNGTKDGSLPDEVQHPSSGINAALINVLSSVPPLLGALSKLSVDLLHEVSTGGPFLADLVDCVLYMRHSSKSQSNMKAEAHESPLAPVSDPSASENGGFPYAAGKKSGLASTSNSNDEFGSRKMHAKSGLSPRTTPASFDLNLVPTENITHNASILNMLDQKETKEPDSHMAGNNLHIGFCCDACGASLTHGPWYKSISKVDYDLCRFCLEEMGDEADYIRLDLPVHQGDLHETPYMSKVFAVKTKPKLDSCFVDDVSVAYGTMMVPSTQFTKIWRMRNNGNVLWDRGTQLVWIGGNLFGNAVSVELEIPADGVPKDGELNIAVGFCAPELPGEYISIWRMASSTGEKFGSRVWVAIQVYNPMMNDTYKTSSGFDLNMIPDCCVFESPGMADIPLQPTTTISLPIPCSLHKHADQKELENHILNSSKNSSLLSGYLVSAPMDHSATSYYPAAPIHLLNPAVDMPTSSHGDASSNNAFEEALAQLEAVFKKSDFHKDLPTSEIYAYQSLARDEELAPVLEKLERVGFDDREYNKALMKLHNGNIDRVYRDLLG